MKVKALVTKWGVIILILSLILFQSITAQSSYYQAPRSFAAGDVQAPTAPKDLQAASITFTSVMLSWKPSVDNVGIKAYEVYCNGKKAASTTAAVYEYKKASPGAAYIFFIKAYDKAGNYSPQSSSISVYTPADKAAPTIPNGLKASSVSETEANLIWTASSDNVNVRGYDILRNGVKIGTTSKTSYCNKNLTPGKSYTYAVTALDGSGNLSNSSVPLTVTTAKDSQAPTAPGELKIAAIKGSSVSLEWVASTDNCKIAGYQIYCNGIVIATAAGTSRIVNSPFNRGTDTYFIKAYDIAGNLSANSNIVTAITVTE
jgi:chitodextrinase